MLGSLVMCSVYTNKITFGQLKLETQIGPLIVSYQGTLQITVVMRMSSEQGTSRLLVMWITLHKLARVGYGN